jgi:formylglycine-generating enzyme required for sulfatase activity
MPDPIVPDMVSIPAGRSWIGSAGADPDARPNEHPAGWVDVPAFAIGRVPVTVEEFIRCVQAGAARPRRSWECDRPPPGQERHPVVNIGWDDAVAYCAWLAAHTGLPFRLPSEAEWERAARGETCQRWPWGDEFHPEYANTREAGRSSTTPVEQHQNGASPFGILDLSGNAWEWTGDLYRTYPYTPTTAQDTPALPAGITESHRRALRGGSWRAEADWGRCSSRVFWQPFYIFSGQVGFRVAYSLESQEQRS